jgi:EmrB/QacA subfamily drug resistance transporter
MDMLTSRADRELPTAQRLSSAVPLIIGSALLLQGIDGTAIMVALPAMAQGLGTSIFAMNLAVSAYLLSIAVFIPASAWIAERFGARATFCHAIGIFVIASLLCGLSRSLPELVAARIFQGFGGALMTPVGRLVLLRSVPRSDYVRAISLFTVPALIGPVLGAPLGGLIVESMSWHWIFFINIPLGLIGIIATLRAIPQSRERHPGPFDLRGFLLLGAGLSLLTMALTGAGQNMRSATLALLTGGGLAALLLYRWHDRRTARPILDLNLLATRSFRVVIHYGTLWRVAMAGVPILTTLLLQLAFGLGPLATGLIVFSGAAGALFMKASAGTIINRFGFRTTMSANAILTAAFAALYGLFDSGTSHIVIVAALFTGGYFRSLQYTGLGTLAFADLPDNAMARASAFASVAQEMAQSIGASLAILLVQGAMLLSASAHPGESEIRLAFMAIGAMGGLAALGFLKLDDQDGAAIRVPSPLT